MKRKAAQEGASEQRTSKYVGVSWNGVRCKWQVRIGHEGVQRSLGYFLAEQEEQAAKRYDTEARRLHGANAQVNFPRAGEAKGAARTRRTAEQMAADRALGTARKSRYVGVSWIGARSQYLVQIRHDGVKSSLGYFLAEQEEQAAERYDKEARRLHGANAQVNFPRAGEAKAAARTTPKGPL